MNRMAREREKLAWKLLAPTLAVILLVALFPLAQTLFYSFTDARLGSVRPWHFVGLRNYLELLADRRFLSSVQLTVAFTVVTVACELVLGMAVALVINGQLPGRGLVRAAILVPWAIPTVVSTQMWKWMYHDVYGVVNTLFMAAGLSQRPWAWIADPSLLFWSACAVDVWKTTPFMALLILAGLQVIPDDLYEAADLDGAGRLHQFAAITLPLLRPTLAVALVFRTLDSLRVFDLFFVMVGNRPGFQPLAVLNQQVLVEYSKLGEGSTLSVALFALIAVFVVLYMRFFRVEEE